MIMVKAFSYGSGTYEIANLLQFQRVDYLAVAFTDEGVELRKAGITLPILILNPEIQSFKVLIEYKLEPEIYSFNILKQFYDAVKSNSVNKYPIHIKLDTGMKRLGFSEKDIAKLLVKLNHYNNLYIKSIFSHLAGSNDPVHDNFTRKQFVTFERLSNEIISKCASGKPVMRHILNSSGIERFSEAQYEMVRLGIGLYGISAENQNKVENISTFKSTISQIKQVALNETIGYDRKGELKRDSIIAIVPVGYADGLSRLLSNGNGKVKINNQIAPIIGNICMDMCMVDITEIAAKEGDEVIIFNDYYSITEMAKQMKTIPYEILTGISQRVKRIYFQE
jgi:alanine racemase